MNLNIHTEEHGPAPNQLENVPSHVSGEKPNFSIPDSDIDLFHRNIDQNSIVDNNVLSRSHHGNNYQDLLSYPDGRATLIQLDVLSVQGELQNANPSKKISPSVCQPPEGSSYVIQNLDAKNSLNDVGDMPNSSASCSHTSDILKVVDHSFGNQFPGKNNIHLSEQESNVPRSDMSCYDDFHGVESLVNFINSSEDLTRSGKSFGKHADFQPETPSAVMPTRD